MTPGEGIEPHLISHTPLSGSVNVPSRHPLVPYCCELTLLHVYFCFLLKSRALKNHWNLLTGDFSFMIIGYSCPDDSRAWSWNRQGSEKVWSVKYVWCFFQHYFTRLMVGKFLSSSQCSVLQYLAFLAVYIPERGWRCYYFFTTAFCAVYIHFSNKKVILALCKIQGIGNKKNI